MADSEHIYSIDISTFEADVIERSKSVLVLLDFWADWCGPCKQLTHILTKVVESLGGLVVLAKANADEQQQLAQHLNIRSLPTVLAVKDGQIVDGFMGALPEGEVRAFVEKHMGDALPGETEAGVEEMNPQDALAEIESAIAANPEDLKLKLEKLRLLLRLGQWEGATQFLAEVTSHADMRDPDTEAFKAVIRLMELSESASEETLAGRLSSDENDLDAKVQFAGLRLLAGDYPQALDHLLLVIKKDRSFEDDFARKSVLGIFEIASDAAMVRDYRRKLAGMLF
ncbi:MAG: tetratricopeptide repeat protein [Pseudomonadota bacterium]